MFKRLKKALRYIIPAILVAVVSMIMVLMQ